LIIVKLSKLSKTAHQRTLPSALSAPGNGL